MTHSKKMFLPVLIVISFGLSGLAQVKEGRVVYERKVNMHKRLADESMKKMIPEFNISKAELFFSGDESLFRGLKEEEDIRDQAGQEEGAHINFKFGSPDAANYRNYATSRGAEQRELGPKKYIVDDSIADLHWKLEADTQTVKGYLCHKAVGRDSRGNRVVAWYAENILSPAGPESFGGVTRVDPFAECQ